MVYWKVPLFDVLHILITHVHIVCGDYLTESYLSLFFLSVVPYHGPSVTIFSSDTYVSTLLYVCYLLEVIQKYAAGHSPFCGHNKAHRIVC
jgi:hypothetical protein